MRRCFWLLNHEPTARQLEDLKEIAGEDHAIVYPPQELAVLWSSLPVKPELDSDILSKVTGWLEGMKEEDIAVVQGDMTYTYYVVLYLRRKRRRVYASVTKRESQEQRTGEKVVKQNVFSHVCFREYVD